MQLARTVNTCHQVFSRFVQTREATRPAAYQRPQTEPHPLLQAVREVTVDQERDDAEQILRVDSTRTVRTKQLANEKGYAPEAL